MRRVSYSVPRGRETPLEGFDVQSSGSQDNTPSASLQSQKRLVVVYGTCCKCGERPATLKSPSGKSFYCAECGRSRCGIHTVADFEQEESTGLWLDPCCFRHNLQQQSLIES